MIALVEHAEGCVVPVRAQPGARRAGVQGEHDGAVKIAVQAPPEDGRANRALVEVLGKVLGVKRSQVELIAGPTSRDKRFLIRGMKCAEVGERLRAVLGSASGGR